MTTIGLPEQKFGILVHRLISGILILGVFAIIFDATFSLSDTFISKSRLVLSIANCEHATVQTSAQTCITIRSAALFVSRTGKLLEKSAVEES